MPIRLPNDENLKAEIARSRRRERREEQQRGARHRMFRVGVIGVFTAVLLVALGADVKNLSRRVTRFQRTGKESRQGDAADIRAGLNGPRYVDPQGRFQVVAPAHWTQVEKPADGLFDVYFRGPFGMDMGIQTVVTPGFTFDQLVARLKQVERGLAADTHMEFAYVGPYRAIRRTAQLFKSKVLMLDFVTGDLSHHVQFATPPELFDEYEPVFLEVMQTYEPGRILSPVSATEENEGFP